MIFDLNLLEWIKFKYKYTNQKPIHKFLIYGSKTNLSKLKADELFLRL